MTLRRRGPTLSLLKEFEILRYRSVGQGRLLLDLVQLGHMALRYRRPPPPFFFKAIDVDLRDMTLLLRRAGAIATRFQCN